MRVSAGPEASPTELFGNRHAVRLMGVPFNVMNEDIVEFFSGIQFSLDILLKKKAKVPAYLLRDYVVCNHCTSNDVDAFRYQYSAEWHTHTG